MTFRRAVAFLGASALVMGSALAQDNYPSRPITLIIGFPPGGGADNVARLYAQSLSQQMGQSVIVENRPGAGTTIAAAQVARAPGDGYTLYLGNASVMGGDNLLYKDINYTPASFSPVTRLTVSPLLLIANKASGIRSVKDIIDRSKATPGSLNYSSSGNGVITHLAGVYFAKLSGINLSHIPYKGGAPSVQSLAAGDTQISFATIASAQAVIDSGRAVGIAVTSAARSPLLPNYPGMKEAGVAGYDLNNWWGIFVPSKTPPAIVDKVFQATQKVLADTELKQKFAVNGDEVAPSASPQAFKAFAEQEGKLNVELIRASGAGVD